MANLLVTGSVAIDSVDAPTGSSHDCLGGSATFFSLAAKRFCPVRLVAVVGEDFPKEYLELLNKQGLDTTGIEVRKGSKTFRWHGQYSQNMNHRETLQVQLNVLIEAGPKIPATYRDSEYVFLANNAPELQLSFLDQLAKPKLVVCDTMDLYIREFRHDLLKVLKRVHGVVVNDSEAELLTGKSNVLTAAKAIAEMGPKVVIVKKGEHGAMLYVDGEVMVIPAYLTETVIDPTGAGDSFAGGMMGYLTKMNASPTDRVAWRNSMLYGTVTASHTVESFSVNALLTLDEARINERLAAYKKMIQV